MEFLSLHGVVRPTELKPSLSFEIIPVHRYSTEIILSHPISMQSSLNVFSPSSRHCSQWRCVRPTPLRDFQIQKFTTSESRASSTMNVLVCHPVRANLARPKENKNFSKLFITDDVAFEFVFVFDVAFGSFAKLERSF